MLRWPQLNDFAYSELTSGFLQIVIFAIKDRQPKLQKQLIKYLVKESFIKKENAEANAEDNCGPPVFDSEPATRLLECILNASNDKLFQYIYKKCFVGNLRVLSLKKSSNFAVQNLLNNCNDKDIVCIIIFKHAVLSK